MIYLDNAATTLIKPPEVIEAITVALKTLGNASRGAHFASLGASRSIFDTRERLAELFNAENPKQIIFTANSTQSLNMAIKGVLNSGDHVITTELEHNSVLRPLYEMQQRGVELSFVECEGSVSKQESKKHEYDFQKLDNEPFVRGENIQIKSAINDENNHDSINANNADELVAHKGRIQTKDFEKLIRKNTRAIVCTHASNLTGNLLDIKKIGEIAKKHNILFIVDASQTAGVFDIDVQDMNIDILCFTGHKSLLAPQGTGGMYVRTGIIVKPLLSGGSGVQTYSKTHPSEMPTALEAGTLNGHGIAGLDAALGYIKKIGIDKIRDKEQALMWHFYEGVRDIPDIKIYGDFETRNRSPIVSLNIGDYDSSEVSDELFTRYDIATRPGAHCAPLMHKALGTVNQGAVRFSFSHYNTFEEIDTAIEAIRTLATE